MNTFYLYISCDQYHVTYLYVVQYKSEWGLVPTGIVNPGVIRFDKKSAVP